MPDRPMTVVLLASDLDGDEGRTARDLACRLAGRGLRVTLLDASGRGRPGAGAFQLVLCPSMSSRWRRGWSIRRALRPECPDSAPVLLHALGASMAPAAIGLSERWCVPYVLSVDEPFGPRARLRVSAARCRALIASSPEMTRELIDGLGVPPALVAEIPFGVERPDRPACPRDLARVPVVAAAARLVPAAGIATFLHAARRIADARKAVEFVVAGTGRAETDLRRLAGRLGIAGRVTFADSPTRDRPFWGVVDVFCQPSLVPCSGRTLATALGHGIPSVASDVAGLRDWLDPDSRGLLAPPGDPEALAASVLELLVDPWTAAEHGRAGRALAALRADPDAEVDALLRLYESALPAGSTPHLALSASSRQRFPAP